MKYCDANGTWGMCIGNVAPTMEICEDYVDNDCDGNTDCDDSDCSAYPHCNGTTGFCNDTDGGKDLFTKGFTSDIDSAIKHDYCTQSGNQVYECTGIDSNCGIKEFYCDSDDRTRSDHINGTEFNARCPKGCKNGACNKACVREAPEYIIHEKNFQTDTITWIVFNFTLTNRENTSCGQSIYNFSAECPSHMWSCNFNKNQVMVDPGETITNKLYVYPQGAAIGSHLIRITIGNENFTIFEYLNLTLGTQAGSCTHQNPSIEITNGNPKTGYPGDERIYDILITNNDNPDNCDSTIFEVSTICQRPYWDCVIPSNKFREIYPGSSSSVRVHITPALNETQFKMHNIVFKARNATIEAIALGKYDSLQPNPDSNRIFVSSETYQGGDFLWVSRADYFCRQMASNANLSGNWKAWFSNDTYSASNRIYHSPNKYVLPVSNIKVADNWDDLTDGSLDFPIKYDEYGNSVGSNNNSVWTGTFANGSTHGGINCDNWRSDYGYGLFGNASSASEEWAYGGPFQNMMCSYHNHIYCIESNN